MLNYDETVNSHTIVPFPPVPCRQSQHQRSEPLPSCQPETEHVRWFVSAAVAEGYQAAQHAYQRMEDEDENGALVSLTGYEYAHLARQYLPPSAPPTQKKDWQRGFILGWAGCVLSLCGIPAYNPLYCAL